MDTKTAVLFAAFAGPAPDFSAFDAPPAAVAASGVVSGPTVSPDGRYELRRHWDGATWVQTWELRKAVSRPATPFAGYPPSTPGTTAHFAPGVSTSFPATTRTGLTRTLVPRGTVGVTENCGPLG
jgi:hypothetical protein